MVRFLFHILSLVLFTTMTHAAAKPELHPFWDVSDENNKATIDHNAWQALLDQYLVVHESGINRVDYASLKSNPADLESLNKYLSSLQSVDPRGYSRAVQMAYWINFYNALTVKVVTDAFPVDSIRDIHESWIPNTGPWGDVYAEVAGQELTLDNIEHNILRPIWKDPRIHYAVNCASIGCPNLSTIAFTASNLEALLEQGARDYINHLRGVDVIDSDFMVISSIYDWFVIDFGDSEEGVLKHLIQYADEELAQQLQDFTGAIDYEYDWDLNQP